MSKILFIFLILLMSSFFIACQEEINNIKIGQVHISGNCGMCKKTIEKAAFSSGVSSAIWNKETKNAEITYDSTKTNLDNILKLIAAVGYDNEKYTATDEAYAELPECCQYGRESLIIGNDELQSMIFQDSILDAEVILQKKSNVVEAKVDNKENAIIKNKVTVESVQETVSFTSFYNAYFDLKDAFVESDPQSVSQKALMLNKDANGLYKKLVGNILYEKSVSFKVKKVIENALNIAENKEIEVQRALFLPLSMEIYDLVKIVKAETDVYYEYCPMYNDDQGGGWLSKEKNIRNPYFGASMLKCGKVKEVISAK